jgi:NADPH:quinone reductase-like Zn-dependent oxidoreductase
MRAALIKAFGVPTEVLELADVPEPSGPAAGEVLVGVEYAPINMNDLYLIQGAFPVRPSLPSIVGNEGVGRVLAVGSGVEHLEVGDRVLIPLYAFSWRERLVLPATGLFSLPEAEPQQLAMLDIKSTHGVSTPRRSVRSQAWRLGRPERGQFRCRQVAYRDRQSAGY